MSKISDELRLFAKDAEHGIGTHGTVVTPQWMRELADRIDSEMVELPKSADGKTWTGREVCFWTGAAEGDYHKFHGLTYTNGRWCVEDKNWQRYPAASAWYERPDSLERIADELDAWCDDSDVDGDACDVPRAISGRIRTLAKREDGNGTD